LKDIMHKPIHFTLIALAAGLIAFSTGLSAVSAQTYPSRPITMTVPFAAGGPTDVLGRLVALRMGEVLGPQIVVENVGGAGGMTGALRVAQAAPDGYSILLGTAGTHAQNQTLYKRPRYNASSDFTPVGLIAEVPIALIVRNDLPVSNLKEFIVYARKNQDKMSYGSAGAGSAAHLACVVLDAAMGTHITHVPYRGTGPAMGDLEAGRIDYLCEIITTAKPQIDGGAVKPIALMSKARSPALPKLPTMTEEGLETAVAYTWNAIFLPKNTPEAIVTRLNGAVLEAMHSSLVKARLAELGAQIVSDDRATPAYLGNFVKSEIEKWAGPIKASGAQTD
jgi:tripartite-type tricarboxylate transporter receptor subunit TctC